MMLGTAFLHAGAVAMNDWHDFKSDRVERPDRPIPAGRMGRWSALFVAIALLGGGWALASGPGPAAGQISLVLLCCVLFHEFLLKNAPIAKAVPAAARGLALLLGMSLIPAAPPPGTVVAAVTSTASTPLRIYFCSILGVYALGTMVLAYRAADGERVAFALAGGIVVGIPIAVLGATRLFFDQAAYPTAVVWIGLLLALSGLPIVWAILRPSETAGQQAAWRADLGTCILEAVMVAFVCGPLVSLPVAAFIIPAFYARGWLNVDSKGTAEQSASLGLTAHSP
jgi:4-hydroxybenzoate polyprenyltransferase